MDRALSPAAKRQASLNNIFRLSAWFVAYLKHNTAAGHYDINVIAEAVERVKEAIALFHDGLIYDSAADTIDGYED